MKVPVDFEEFKGEYREKEKKQGKLAVKIVGLIIGFFLLYWFFSNANLNEIWSQISSVGFKFFILIFIMFLSFYIDTVGWKLCFSMPIPSVSVFELFLIRLSGESLAQINPTNVIAGDTMKAVLLKRKGVEYTNSIVSLTVYRFISVLAVATFIIAGVIVFFDYIGVFAQKQTIIIGIVCFVIMNIAILYRIQTGKGLFSPLVSILHALTGKTDRMQRTINKLNEIDSELTDFFRSKKINFIGAYIFSLIHRLPEVFEYFVIFSFLGIKVTLLSCLAVSVGVTVFKALGSFIPAQLGIEEYGNKVMLEFIKVSGSSTWLSVSILRRARQLVWILLGVAAFFIIVKKGQNDRTG